jgi:type II secretion system-associated lipoprotein
MIKVTSVLIMITLFISCSSGEITKKRVKYWNDDLRTRNFSAKTDIRQDFVNTSSDTTAPLLFKKGEEIRIWAESGSDWIRFKAYRVKESREQASGTVILYLFYEEVLRNKKDKKVKDSQYLESEIIQRLDQIIVAKDKEPVIRPNQ